ncbi:Imm21 family immunity protein [Corallococcus interemptor]|uniref:Imm21 family immunity protein n=1 Tax=Corallococcus interemptor TaxID=2316720 RepID=UPI003CFC2C10
MMKVERSEWIESLGGPLVMLPVSKRKMWAGARTNDYDEACSIYSSSGIIPRDWGDVVVLADEPLRTCVILRPEGPMIVRWRYAPDEEVLLQAVSEFEPGLHSPVERVSFRSQAEPYVIVDSVEDASLARGIEVRLSDGVSRMVSYEVNDKQRQVAVLVRVFE